MGFNAKASFDRTCGGAGSLGTIYRSPYLARRLGRLLTPLAIAVAVSVGIAWMKDVPLYFGPLTLLLSMPVPLVGQFFVTLSLMFVALAPMLYLAYRKAPGRTLILSLVATAIFEAGASQVDFFKQSYYVYQVIPLRFVPLFVLGMWLADGAALTPRRNWFILPSAAVSALYLVLYSAGFRTGLLDFEHMYTFLAFGYPLLLVASGLNYLPQTITGPGWQALAELGKASYHVFLVQAVWFSTPITLFRQGDLRWVPVSLAVCCGVGWAWYRAERMLTSRRSARGGG